MISRLLRHGALLAAVFVLPSDNCRDPARLVNFAEQGIAPAQHWYQAALASNKQALASLTQYAKQHHQQHWLQQASLLGDANALYTLALTADDAAYQRELLLKAAKLEHPISQYELALASERNSSRLYWLQKAAANDVLMAQISLYQWWLLQGDKEQALPWIAKAAEQDADSALIMGRIYWQQEQQSQAIKYFNLAARGGNVKAKEYLHHINVFVKAKHQPPPVAEQPPTCAMRLQFVANSLDSIIQAEAFRQKLVTDQRLQSLALCVNPPLWISPKELNCNDNWRGQKRIGCELGGIAQKAETLDFDHLVIFTLQGKANVHNGIMFLDQTDSYQVFVHELAHFAGFVDEYPLNEAMAANICGQKSAPNLLFSQPLAQAAHIEETEELEDAAAVEVTAIADAREELDISPWLSLGYAIQVSEARTCDNHSAQAYKPVSAVTFMEYHESGNIPDIYLTQWKKVLTQRKDLVPVFVNFAQYYEQQNNLEKAKYWRQKYRRFIVPPVNVPSSGILKDKSISREGANLNHILQKSLFNRSQFNSQFN